MNSDYAEIKIAVAEVTPTSLRVCATVYNRSPETSVRLFIETSSFLVAGASGEVGWLYIGEADPPAGVTIEPQGTRIWETVLPTSRHFESLGPEFPGFVPLHPGCYTLQLVGDLDWLLPITTYSLQQRDSLIADGFSPTVVSNISHFQIA